MDVRPVPAHVAASCDASIAKNADLRKAQAISQRQKEKAAKAGGTSAVLSTSACLFTPCNVRGHRITSAFDARALVAGGGSAPGTNAGAGASAGAGAASGSIVHALASVPGPSHAAPAAPQHLLGTASDARAGGQ